jgi:pyroglutamyl-peptidase
VQFLKELEDAGKNLFSEIDLKTMLLEVSFHDSVEALQKMILQYRPDVVLSFGFTWVDRIHIERRAINKSEGLDSDGEYRSNWPVIEGGPDFLNATIPVRTIQRELVWADIPAKVNWKPTQYVCNNLFYSTLDFIQKNNLSTKSGFIHVPNVFKIDPKTGLKTYAVDKPEYRKNAMSQDALRTAGVIILESIFNAYLKPS